MHMGVAPDANQKVRMVHYYPGCSRELLCRCKYFDVERIQVTLGASFSVMDSSFQVLLCLKGEGEIHHNIDQTVRFLKGECLFIPAGAGRCHIEGEAVLLKTRC